jgi:hypothetical protein
MHVFSILTLISVAAFATAASSPVVVEKTETELGGSCYSSSTWMDKLKNKCEWYAEKELRCRVSGLFEVNGVSAKDECCACGGGTKEDYAGTYYIQNVNNGRYLYSNGYSVSTTTSQRYRGGRVAIEPTGDNQWALRFISRNKYLSFNTDGSVGAVSGISARATFDIEGIVSIVSSGGSAFKNSVTKTYLSVSSSGFVEEVADVFSTNDQAVFKLISSSAALEEDKKELS